MTSWDVHKSIQYSNENASVKLGGVCLVSLATLHGPSWLQYVPDIFNPMSTHVSTRTKKHAERMLRVCNFLES